jgi:putative ABC transport system permease protein
MKFLHLVWRNLMRRKIRTIITVLAILVGFVLFGATMAIRAAFSLGVEVAGADRLVTIHRVSLIQLLPKSYGDRIRALEGVTDVTHANWFGAYYQNTDNFFANMAVDPESWLRMYPEFRLPEDQKKAWIANRTGAIVGVDTAKKFNWKVGDRIPLISPIYRKPDGSPWELIIEGVYDSPIKGTDKTQLFFHWEYVNETFRKVAFINDQVGWYVVRVADPSTSDQLAKRIDALFANSPAETKTATEKAFVSDFAKQIGDIGAIMIAIAGAMMFTILLVAGNTMAQSIRERTSELGVLKTLGFGNGRILTLVLLESCAIAVIGGGTGLWISWILIAQGDPTNGLLPAFYFPVRDLIAGIALVLTLGLGTGILPALQASRLKIVDALRRT